MSAMHSALRIREIQLLIIDQIVGDAFETNEKLNLSQHRTVLSFALCCNDFWRAALPTLWRTVPSLLSVIKTFPSTLWEDVKSQLIREPQTPIYETYDLSENDSMFADDDVSHLDYQQYQLVFIRDINKEDWSRFQAHAQYVRKLTLVQGVQGFSLTDHELTHPRINDKVFGQMARWCPATNWFPKLETLVVPSGTHLDLLPARSLIHSNVKSFVWNSTMAFEAEDEYDQEAQAFADIRRESALKGFLDTLSWLSPNLSTIDITTYRIENYVAPMVNLLTSRKIEKLKLWHRPLEDEELILAIARSPLRLLACGLSTSMAWYTVVGPRGELGMPSLTSATLMVADLVIISTFLSILANANMLRVLQVYCKHEPSCKEFRDFLDFEIKRTEPHQLQTFHMMRESAFGRDYSPSSISKAERRRLRISLTNFFSSRPSLTDVAIQGIPQAFMESIDRGLLEQITSSLPRIEKLDLRIYVEPHEQHEKHLDLGDVVRLCNYRPSLRYLALSGVDCSKIPSKSFPKVKLRHLRLVGAYIDQGEEEDFVRFCIDYLPLLEYITSPPWKLGEQWTEMAIREWISISEKLPCYTPNCLNDQERLDEKEEE